MAGLTDPMWPPLWVGDPHNELLVCLTCFAVAYRADWPHDTFGWPRCVCGSRRVPDVARHLPGPEGGVR